MVSLKDELNSVLTHPYMKVANVENKNSFGWAIYKLFIHTKNVVEKINNPIITSGLNIVLDDWLNCAYKILYNEKHDLTIQNKLEISSYLNIVFRELSHFIACGEFYKVTKDNWGKSTDIDLIYPQYQYDKASNNWILINGAKYEDTKL